MALKLLYERQLGQASKLAPYVAALPSEVSTPLSWTEPQLQALRYPHLLQEVQTHCMGSQQFMGCCSVTCSLGRLPGARNVKIPRL